MMDHETVGQAEVRQQLEAQLAPGEQLLAYTRGQIPGVLGARTFLLGLTRDRLILLSQKREKAGTQIHTVWRENILNLRWSPLWARFKIGLDQTTLEFAPRGGYWKRHAKHLVELFGKLPDPSQGSIGHMTQRRLAQARDFNSLGLYSLAQSELRKLESAYSSESRPEIETLSRQLADRRFALRAAAGFLLGNAGLTVLLAGLASVGTGPMDGSQLCSFAFSALIVSYIAMSLWRGRIREGQSWAIIVAVLGVLFAASAYTADGSLLDLIMQLAFSASMLLVLIGQPKRARTLAAIALYTAGFVGPFLLALFAGVVGIPLP